MTGSPPVAMSGCWGGGPLTSMTFCPKLGLRKCTWNSLMLVTTFTSFFPLGSDADEWDVDSLFLEIEENVRLTHKQKCTILTSEDEPLREEEEFQEEGYNLIFSL